MILHIPHSSTAIPDWATGTVPAAEIALMTDWFTDRLFSHPAALPLVFPWSRYVCDVERLLDDPMEKIGQGLLYTHLRDGTRFRTPQPDEKAGVLALYKRWHRRMRIEAGRLVSLFPLTVVVDCHSFCAAQVDMEESALQDVCIGINTDQDPQLDSLVTVIRDVFEQHGYSTAINHPYGGAIEPSADPGLLCVMIELNKRIYLGPDHAPSDGFPLAHAAISAVLDKIDSYEQAA